MGITMSWVSLNSMVESSSEYYGLTDKTKCRVILLPKAEDFFTLAFAVGCHETDKTAAVLSSRQYKTIGRCLKDRELCAPEWYYFALTPSGKYIVARQSFYIVVIKLHKKYPVSDYTLKEFNNFRKYIRRWRQDTDAFFKNVKKDTPQIIRKLNKRIDAIQSRIQILNEKSKR